MKNTLRCRYVERYNGPECEALLRQGYATITNLNHKTKIILQLCVKHLDKFVKNYSQAIIRYGKEKDLE